MYYFKSIQDQLHNIIHRLTHLKKYIVEVLLKQCEESVDEYATRRNTSS